MIEPIERYYTCKDLRELPDDVRAEIIYGELFMMSPAPTGFHQYISVKLEKQISDFLEDKPCEMFHAPLDVRLFQDDDELIDDVDTVVEPDIFVACQPIHIDKHGYRVVPKLVIEILSPSTAKRDRIDKKKIYERAGVREYWIVDQSNHIVDVYLLGENGKYGASETYSEDDTVKVSVLSGCEIDLSKVFPEESDQ